MINVSNEFKQQMQENTEFKQHADIHLANNTVIELKDSNFTISGNKIVDGFGNGFPLGVAVARTITIEIANYDDEYSDVDFYGARIHLFLDYYLEESNRIETVSKGWFTVIEPETYGSTIEITAIDDMWKANAPYTTNLDFDNRVITLWMLLEDCCRTAKINMSMMPTLPNGDFVVKKKPENMTFRDVIGYCAMIAGGNARINNNGYLNIISYDKGIFERLDDTINGGSFLTETTPYSDGDSIDGGDFTFTDTDVVDGGNFKNWNVLPMLASWSDLKVDTDDVIITGIKFTYTDSEEKEQSLLIGETGYVIEAINPLLDNLDKKPQEQIDKFTSLFSDRIIGLRFRTFDGEHIANPLVEFMDCVAITDRKRNVYNTIITDVEFNFFGYTNISNQAEPALRHSTSNYTKPSKEVQETQRLIQQEKTAREVAMKNMAEQIASSSGLYQTTEPQPDGSNIYYMHDKPTLAESMIVWKLTAQVIGISTDGGQTYPVGLDATGTAILEKIYTIGLDADHITAGTLSSRNGKTYFDLENNQIVTENDIYKMNLSDAIFTISRDGVERFIAFASTNENDTGALKLTSKNGNSVLLTADNLEFIPDGDNRFGNILVKSIDCSSITVNSTLENLLLYIRSTQIVSNIVYSNAIVVSKDIDQDGNADSEYNGCIDVNDGYINVHDLYVDRLSANSSIPYEVEWVWSNELSRFVLCAKNQ